MALPYMTKHKKFPGRFPGTDHQFVIRRANKKGATPITRRERYADRRNLDKKVDAAFLAALWTYFGEEPCERGNLDAGRLSWLIGREVVPDDPDDFDPADYEALLRIDVKVAETNFPEVFASPEEFAIDDWEEDDEWDEEE